MGDDLLRVTRDEKSTLAHIEASPFCFTGSRIWSDSQLPIANYLLPCRSVDRQAASPISAFRQCASKANPAHRNDVRHRALLHHSEGIFLCERLFGVTIRNADGRDIPVRFIGEQHVALCAR